MLYPTFAQLSYGNEKAAEILNSSLALQKGTAESWQRLWDISVSPDAPIWQALCQLGGFIAATSLIYLMIKESSDRTLFIGKVIDMAKFPLAIGVMLGGNGYYLAGIVLYIRSLGLYWLTRILEMTFAGVSISHALGKMQNTSVANARAREIFSECIDKAGIALAECVQDPIKQQQVQQMGQVLNGGTTAPLKGNALEQIGNQFTSALVSTINIPFINAMQFFLTILQWCFVNFVEASLILTALFCPIALGLSILPATGPTIIKWFSGYVSLLLMNLGYVILVGFVATVLVLTEQGGQPLGSSFMDTAFLLFIAVFAPALAVKVSQGIGDGIFEGISRAAKSTVDAGVSMASAGAPVIAKEIAARAAAKTLN